MSEAGVLWIVGAITAVVVLIVIGIPIACVRTVLRMIEYTPPLNTDETPPDLLAEDDDILIATPDGLTLRGSLYRPERDEPRGLVVFCHELGSSRWSALSYCEALFQAGFAVLSFDFRNHGDSDALAGYDPFHWLTHYEVDDVQAAIDYVSRRPDLNRLPLWLFGVSRGGSAALAVAAEADSVTGVICEGAYASHRVMSVFAKRFIRLLAPDWCTRLIPGWHVEITLWLARRISQRKRRCRYVRLEKRLTGLRSRPVLLISGERDNYILPEIAEALKDAIPSPDAQLWIVPAARHNEARESAPEEYDNRIVSFVDDVCPDRSAVERPQPEETDAPDATQPSLATGS